MVEHGTHGIFGYTPGFALTGIFLWIWFFILDFYRMKGLDVKIYYSIQGVVFLFLVLLIWFVSRKRDWAVCPNCRGKYVLDPSSGKQIGAKSRSR